MYVRGNVNKHGERGRNNRYIHVFWGHHWSGGSGCQEVRGEGQGDSEFEMVAKDKKLNQTASKFKRNVVVVSN